MQLHQIYLDVFDVCVYIYIDEKAVPMGGTGGNPQPMKEAVSKHTPISQADSCINEKKPKSYQSPFGWNKNSVNKKIIL